MSGVPQAERPALMVGANLEGNQLIGSEIALGLIRRITKLPQGKGHFISDGRKGRRGYFDPIRSIETTGAGDLTHNKFGGEIGSMRGAGGRIG